jgi:hypothetical protein
MDQSKEVESLKKEVESLKRELGFYKAQAKDKPKSKVKRKKIPDGVFVMEEDWDNYSQYPKECHIVSFTKKQLEQIDEDGTAKFIENDDKIRKKSPTVQDLIDFWNETIDSEKQSEKPVQTIGRCSCGHDEHKDRCPDETYSGYSCRCEKRI